MSWPVVIVEQPADLPAEKGGVYLLFIGALLDYVGQSDQVRRRLLDLHHVYDPTLHTRIAVILEGTHETRLALERYFNHRYNPPNSFTGTDKQATAQQSGWHTLSPTERRTQWKGPAFTEFDPLRAEIGPEHPQTLTQTQVNHSALGVPSLIAFRAGEVRRSSLGRRRRS